MSIFNRVKRAKVQKSKFDLSHEVKTTFNPGELIPVLNKEMLPGDKWKGNTEILIRMAPMLAPLMHRINVYTHFFFVPFRLLWNEWEPFITGGDRGDKVPVFPKIMLNETTKTYTAKGSLFDHLGIPPLNQKTITAEFGISSLPFKAYQLIYNEYYRDQTIDDDIFDKDNNPDYITLDSGHIDSADEEFLLCVAKRSKRWDKDYFTSCLPEAQKGEAVDVPLHVTGQGQYYEAPTADGDYDKYNPGSTVDIQSGSTGLMTSSEVGVEYLGLDPGTTIDVNDLRKVTRIQRWLERQARAGSRYCETLLSHFGVHPGDHQLQRPVYCGGGIQPVQVSEVLQHTPDSGSNSVVGDMYGHGISVGGNNNFQYSANEHGILMGICCVMPKATYSQGINKEWRRFDKFDYGWPEFANLGEQEVKNHEIFYEGEAWNVALDTFGYQQRYAEYKYANSRVSSEFRDTLEYWTMNRKFNTKPTLSSTFLTMQNDTWKKPFAVQSYSDYLWANIYHNISAIRPLPYDADPRL